MPAKGLIPQAFIDDLLSRVDVVEVISRRLTLKKTGRNYSARCPFHDEKTPSFSVNPDKQFFYCFGCGAGGNALSFVMDYDRLDFPAAVENLAQLAGVEVPREELSPQQAQRQARRKDVYALMESIAEHYRQQLRDHPEAQRAVDYLRRRGLSAATAREFDIGFAPPGWDNVLGKFARDEDSRQQLLDTGMLVSNDEGRVYDRFRDRIMFPIRDNRGRVVGFGGRVLGDEKPKYLNSPESDIFHKSRELYGLYRARQENRQLDQLLVVEGYMDVVALAQHGIHRAVATLGTASNSDHLRSAFRYCNELVFCFDGDDAGRKAARRAMENALPVMEDGRQIRFLFLPEGEDPDSIVQQRGGDGFLALVAKADSLEQYLFDSVSQDLDLDSMEGRASLSKRAVPLLQQLPDGVYRELMLSALAQRAGLPRTTLDQLLLRAQQAQPPSPSADAGADEPRNGDVAGPGQGPRRASSRQLQDRLPASRRDPVLLALAMLLYNPGCADSAPLPDSLREAEANSSAALLKQLIELLQRRPGASTASLLGHWYGHPEYELLTEALKTIELLTGSIDDDAAARTYADTLAHLSAQQGQRSIRAELRALREAEQVDKPQSDNYAELDDNTRTKLHAIQQMLSKKHKGQEKP